MAIRSARKLTTKHVLERESNIFTIPEIIEELKTKHPDFAPKFTTNAIRNIISTHLKREQVVRPRTREYGKPVVYERIEDVEQPKQLEPTLENVPSQKDEAQAKEKTKETQEVVSTEIGESIIAYIGDLKHRIDQMGMQLRDLHGKYKSEIAVLKSDIQSKQKEIQELKSLVASAPQRRSTFNMGEIAHFKK